MRYCMINHEGLLFSCNCVWLILDIKPRWIFSDVTRTFLRPTFLIQCFLRLIDQYVTVIRVKAFQDILLSPTCVTDLINYESFLSNAFSERWVTIKNYSYFLFQTIIFVTYSRRLPFLMIYHGFEKSKPANISISVVQFICWSNFFTYRRAMFVVNNKLDAWLRPHSSAFV